MGLSGTFTLFSKLELLLVHFSLSTYNGSTLKTESVKLICGKLMEQAGMIEHCGF